MSATPLHELSIAEAGRKLRDGSITSLALTEDALARIAAIDPALDSFITVTAERARADAAAADADFAREVDRGPMQAAILNGHVAAWLSSCELGLDVRRRF